MESLDLNIDNYNLSDILSLFNLPTLFNEDDLKRAKLAVNIFSFFRSFLS